MIARCWLLCALLTAPAAFAAGHATPASPYGFTDEPVVVALDPAPTPAHYRWRVTTLAGPGEWHTAEATPTDGKVSLALPTEGVVTFQFLPPVEAETQVLVMAPPAKLDADLLGSRLPRCSKALLDGSAVNLLAVGDELVEGAAWPELARRLLARATGNTKLTLTTKAWPGRGAEAAVDGFDSDIATTKPGLVLVQHATDDTALPSLETYLEQYRWLAGRLVREAKADTVLVEPLPDPTAADGSTLMRALAPACWLEALGDAQHIPVAPSFEAVWGQGGPGLPATVQAIATQFEPTASGARRLGWLGQLAVARSVLLALSKQDDAPLHAKAELRWTSTGVAATVSVKNVTKARRTGLLLPLARPGEELTSGEPVTYNLGPDETATFTVRWPQVKTPADLLKYPANRYLAGGHAVIPLVEVAAGHSRPYAVAGRFAVEADLVRHRETVEQNSVLLTLDLGGRAQRREIRWPDGSDVGRLQLLEPVVNEAGDVGWAAAEIAYTRYAGVMPGDAVVDGDLREWRAARWSPVGEPCQARSARGLEDHRATPQEAYLRWSLRWGRTGLYLGIQGTGQLAGDGFTLGLDPRPSAFIGSVGRVFQLSGLLRPAGVVELTPGTTSPQPVAGLKGAWKPSAAGADIEAYFPYALMRTTEFPTDGVLGVSFAWHHTGPNGAVTHLLWSDDSAPTNPRWFGLAAQLQHPKEPLPWLVRVK